MQATTVVEGFRLSPQQRRIWRLQRETSAFVSQLVLLVEGDVCVERMREAVERVCARHEALRTVFRRLPGVVMPVQVVSDEVSVSWQVIPLEETKKSVEELVEFESKRAFDYEHGPLVNATLVPIESSRRLLSITIPALCADRRTLSNLGSELWRELSGADEADEEPLQYIQFSEWQNSLAEEDDAEKAREYWSRTDLSNASAVLPGQSVRQRVNGGVAGELDSVKLNFTPEYATRIAALATKHDTTSATVLLAAWQTLLWRLTQQSIVIGNVTEGRSYELLHDGFGLFARALPVSCQFTEDLRFSEVIAELDRVQYESEEWQDYFNLDDAPEGSLQHFPFGYEYAEIGAQQQANGLRVSVFRQTSTFEIFDLKLTSVMSAEGIELVFDYNAAVFDLPYVNHLAEQFQTLLDAALANPETSVAELEIVSAAERQQIVVEWNNTARDYELDQPVHQLFEQQVSRTPDALAAVFQNEQLTFAELNRRANQLAAYLKDQGVGPETPVGICIDPSLEMLIAVFGILKAGGAYVPLDPRNPQQRINQVLQDAGASILLKRELVTNPRTEPADNSQTEIAAEIGPDNLAYIIYTSGSTGQPKGVMIQHRSVANLAAALHEDVYTGLGDALKVGLSAPLAFDASVKQLVQLLHGHTLHILPEELRLDARAALDYLDQHQIDVLDCTPSQLKLLLAAGLNKDTRTTPRLMLIGGEAIDESTWSHLAEDHHTRFFNVYGPTECTVDATWTQITTGQANIGRPVPNAQAYILDQNLKPTSVHLTGELFISGTGLARGYLDSPERTAERFIPDALSGAEGARLYRTGDLARYTHDGSIIYTGRNDTQVKVRGHRIELGEIEAVLQQQEDVKQAVVLARETSVRQQHAKLKETGVAAGERPEGQQNEHPKQAGTHRRPVRQQDATPKQTVAAAGEAAVRQENENATRAGTHETQQHNETVIEAREDADVRLVGYVVPKDGAKIDTNALRQKLTEQLPDYMVPSFIVPLDELPLTRNGKVDANALPPPETAQRSRDEHYVAPRNEIEATITRVWQDALGLERIGVNDNFFDAGGHSLLMVQVHNKLTDLFDKKISIVEMFAKPTISALAEYFSDTNGHKPTFERVMDRAARRRQAVSMRQ
jgi:amino acid adenylation domain-containing protein